MICYYLSPTYLQFRSIISRFMGSRFTGEVAKLKKEHLDVRNLFGGVRCSARSFLFCMIWALTGDALSL